MSRPLPSADMIPTVLNTLLDPGPVAELRVPKTSRGALSGSLDVLAALAFAAAELSGRVEGVYLTMNPVNPELLARALNRVVPYAKHTSSDLDILRRRWMLVDFDPKRPAGISSTATEHEAALARARLARDWL